MCACVRVCVACVCVCVCACVRVCVACVRGLLPVTVGRSCTTVHVASIICIWVEGGCMVIVLMDSLYMAEHNSAIHFIWVIYLDIYIYICMVLY